MSECELLVTTYDRGQELAGTVTLKDGKISYKSQKGYEDFMKSLIGDKIIIGDKTFDPKEDPAGWIRNLPKAYSGSAFRAKTVMKGNKKT
jgi:hypothetical protein